MMRFEFCYLLEKRCAEIIAQTQAHGPVGVHGTQREKEDGGFSGHGLQ